MSLVRVILSKKVFCSRTFVHLQPFFKISGERDTFLSTVSVEPHFSVASVPKTGGFPAFMVKDLALMGPGDLFMLLAPGGEGRAPLHRDVMVWDGPPGVFWGMTVGFGGGDTRLLRAPAGSQRVRIRQLLLQPRVEQPAGVRH